ncbi:MAG: PD-(D/E)XK nuclease family protein [Candidatus Hydrogenedens sp.]
MTRNLILCGSQRSDRKNQTQKILRENYISALLIVPTRQYAQKRRIELLNDIAKPTIEKNIVTDFTQFAYNLLKAQYIPIHLLEEWEQTLLIRSIILSEEGRKKFEQYQGLLAPDNLSDSFHRIIRNLKQAGITPEAFQEQIKKLSVEPWDEVVSWVYTTYQEKLMQSNGYDVPGLFWQAELECHKGKPDYIAGKEYLIFDGFDDFTQSELRLIHALSPHFKHIIIGINLDPIPGRQDIYRLAKDALKRVQSILDAKTIYFETPIPQTSIEFIADTLFGRDEPKTFTPSTDSIIKVERFINREEEIKNIGRKIKQLLVQEHVPLHKIAVVYRQLGKVRPLIEKTFMDYGIPYRILSSQGLRETWVGQFLERWFAQLNENSLSAITLLLHDPLWNISPSIREKFFLLLSQVGLSMSMSLDYVNKKIEEKEHFIEYSSEIENKNISKVDIQQFYDELKRWLFWRNKFKRQDKISNYIFILLDLFHSLENALKDCLLNEDNKRKLQKEKKGYLQFLSVIKKLPDYLKNQGLSLEEFQRLIRSLSSDASFFDMGHNCGVMCLDLPMIRNMEYDYLFVGGVEEGTIPLTPTQNVLYSDKDITKLRQSGLPIDDITKQIQREWLFFQQIFETTRKGVFLSHALYSETHRECSSSLLLRECQEVCQYIVHNSPQKQEEIEKKPFIPCSPSELRNLLFYIQEDEQVLKHHYADIYNCWYSLQKREEENENIYTGNLHAEDIRQWLTNKFGHDHVYSVDQIEEYIECPFRFWTHRVLALQDWEEELIYPSPLMIGSWAHDTLFRLLKDHYEELLRDKSQVIKEKLQQIIQEIVSKDRKSFVLPKKWIDLTIEWLTHVLAEFLNSSASLIDNDWKPAYFELAFGRTMYPSEDERSQHKPYCMETQKKSVLFSGRIDRIDKHVSNPLLRVIDYKWGNTPTKTDMGIKFNNVQERFCSFQLIIYELAVERHLFQKEGLSVEESYFLSITEQKKTGTPWGVDKNLRNEIENIAVKIILDTIGNIHQGKFTPAPYKKQSCDYCFCKTACRYMKVEQSGISEDEESGEAKTA